MVVVEKKAVPELRFPEFDGDWASITLGAVSVLVTSGSRDWARYYSVSGDKFIRMTNLPKNGIRLSLDDLRYVSLPESGSEGARTSLKPKDILISITAELGKIGLVPETLGIAYINQHTALVRLNSDVNAAFVAHQLSSHKTNIRLNRLNDSGAKSGLNLSTIKKFKVIIPSLSEQQKIADFLGSIDNKLTSLRRKHELLQDYKRGMMQKIFSQELRFKQEDGSDFPDWEEKRLGDVFNRIKRKNIENNKNVLTISAQQGLVKQRDYFNKSVSASDVSSYYLLYKGDFAYNKSYSKGYPLGAIKRLKSYAKGVVSTLYICFGIEEEITSQFFEQYFESGYLNRELHKIAQEGVRNHGLLNMSVVDFFKGIQVFFPDSSEQQKIADFLSAIDVKIEVVSEQVKQIEQFKKGLLQKMFV